MVNSSHLPISYISHNPRSVWTSPALDVAEAEGKSFLNKTAVGLGDEALHKHPSGFHIKP